MQALNYAKKSRGRDLLIQEQLKQYDLYNLQNMMVLEKNKDLQFVDRVLNPEKYDVMVMPNLYGDILSDLGAGLVGGLGIIPGANIGKDYAVFEAVHGSAPQIAGQNKANPTALIQSAVMMLRYLGEQESALKIEKALEEVFKNGEKLTVDLGGNASTTEFADEVCEYIN